MGADMVVAIVATPKDVTPDFEAGRQFIAKMKDADFQDEDLLNELVENGLDDGSDFFDENDQPIVGEIRAWLTECIGEFERFLNGRGVGTIWVRDLVLYITGGMSWGDSTEEAYAFWRIGAVPGLLSAMGFVTNWHEEDPTVSPEEEAAAVQSIVAGATERP